MGSSGGISTEGNMPGGGSPGGRVYAVVGLGNPGSEYERTRHNAGYWLLDAFFENQKSSLSAGRWTEDKSASYQKLKIQDREVLLIKPLRFMNRSGEAAFPLLRFFKVPLSNILLAYDDLDLAPGTIRLKQGGSSGGHRGVSDFARVAGSEDFARLRIGIGHPRDRVPEEERGRKFDVTSWVLGRPGSAEAKQISEAINLGVRAVEDWMSHGFLLAQQRLHSAQKG